jgi:hypothetical protein
MISCAQMAEILEAAALTAKAELAVPTEELMAILESEAKNFIGHYQDGWEPLAPSTIKGKTDLGYAPPDNPLLREGDMRDSIKHRSAVTGEGAIGEIGSDEMVALWQEMGASRGIPPRSFLGLAMSRSQEPATAIFGAFGAKLLTGK